MLGYRCTGCHRLLARRERIYCDDPQAPFGPEWLCPSCESRVALYASPAIVGLAVAMTGLLGLALGVLLSRL
jgi:hypothetical protein